MVVLFLCARQGVQRKKRVRTGAPSRIIRQNYFSLHHFSAMTEEMKMSEP
jgi:hypothetical protein